jgi:two-component system, LytTR family, sensor kinase
MVGLHWTRKSFVPRQRRFIPPEVSLMPESFVERGAPFIVDRSRWSRRMHWGAMPVSPSARAVSPALQLVPGRQRTAWLIVLAGWTVVGLGYFLSSAFAAPEEGQPATAWVRLLLFSVGTAWIWAALTPAVLWLTRNATLATGNRARSAAVYVLTGVGFFVASGVLEWILGLATGRVTAGQFWSTLLFECLATRLLAYLAIVTLGRTAYYFALYRTRQLHASDLETRLARTHLQVLKTQLQPHFLFNTLNAVAELVHTEPDAADLMITRLGRLLRLSLDNAGHQVVPLRQEIDFLRVYLDIEQVRFQDRLQIVWDVAAETLEAAVPTLLWQPVLENAIRHGVTPLAGRGRIVIASRKEGDDLVLEIRDNGTGLPAGVAPREGVGLRNIRERVYQLYGLRAVFSLAPALGGGTVASLRLPFTPCEGPQTPVPLSQSNLREIAG